MQILDFRMQIKCRTAAVLSRSGLEVHPQEKVRITRRVGIGNISMFRLCNRPWVVNTSDRIIQGRATVGAGTALVEAAAVGELSGSLVSA
jgi:hypothetical protein